jgi:hypothetical protein
MLPTPSCYRGATVYSLLRVSRGQTASIGIESVVTEPLGMGSQLLSPCVVSTVHIYVRLCGLPVPSPTGDSTLKDPETLGVWRIISSVPGGAGSWQLQGHQLGHILAESVLSPRYPERKGLTGQSPEVVICGSESMATVLGKLGSCTASWAELLQGTGDHDSPEVGVGRSSGQGAQGGFHFI